MPKRARPPGDTPAAKQPRMDTPAAVLKRMLMYMPSLLRDVLPGRVFGPAPEPPCVETWHLRIKLPPGTQRGDRLRVVLRNGARRGFTVPDLNKMKATHTLVARTHVEGGATQAGMEVQKLERNGVVISLGWVLPAQPA